MLRRSEIWHRETWINIFEGSNLILVNIITVYSVEGEVGYILMDHPLIAWEGVSNNGLAVINYSICVGGKIVDIIKHSLFILLIFYYSYSLERHIYIISNSFLSKGYDIFLNLSASVFSENFYFELQTHTVALGFKVGNYLGSTIIK